MLNGSRVDAVSVEILNGVTAGHSRDDTVDIPGSAVELLSSGGGGGSLDGGDGGQVPGVSGSRGETREETTRRGDIQLGQVSKRLPVSIGRLGEQAKRNKRLLLSHLGDFDDLGRLLVEILLAAVGEGLKSSQSSGLKLDTGPSLLGGSILVSNDGGDWCAHLSELLGGQAAIERGRSGASGNGSRLVLRDEVLLGWGHGQVERGSDRYGSLELLDLSIAGGLDRERSRLAGSTSAAGALDVDSRGSLKGLLGELVLLVGGIVEILKLGVDGSKAASVPWVGGDQRRALISGDS